MAARPSFPSPSSSQSVGQRVGHASESDSIVSLRDSDSRFVSSLVPVASARWLCRGKMSPDRRPDASSGKHGSGSLWYATTQFNYDQIIYTWKIRNFDAYLKSAGRGEPIGSDVFFSAKKPTINWKWMIIGQSPTSCPHTTVILEIRNENAEPVVADAELSIINGLKEEVMRRNSGKVFTLTVQKAELFDIVRGDILDAARGYLTDGTLTIRCVLKYLIDVGHAQSQFTRVEFPQVTPTLSCMLNNDFLADFTIIVGDARLPVHKMALAAASPVFYAMFQHRMAENESSEMEIVDAAADVIGLMLRYIYAGAVELTGCLQSEQLLAVADKYQIQGLKLECEKYFCENLTEDNRQELLRLSSLYSAHRLRQTIDQSVEISRFDNNVKQ